MIRNDNFIIPAKFISTFCLSKKLASILREGCYYNIFITKSKLPIVEIEHDNCIYNVNISRFDLELGNSYVDTYNENYLIGKIPTDIGVFYGYKCDSDLYSQDINKLLFLDTDIRGYKNIGNQSDIKKLNDCQKPKPQLSPEYFSQKEINDVLEILDSVNQLPIKNKKKDSLQKFIDAVSDLSNNTIESIKLSQKG